MEEEQLILLREKYKNITDDLLFFPISGPNESDENYKKQKFIDLFVETWDHIPENDKIVILNNLEFILCKKVEEYQTYKETPAITHYITESHRCFIMIDPFSFFLQREKEIYIFAHELAHAVLNHPDKGYHLDCHDKELEYIIHVAEPEAKDYVEDVWNIYPYPKELTK